MRSTEEQEDFLEHGRFGEGTRKRVRVDQLVWIGLLFLLVGAALFGSVVVFNIGRDDGGPLFVQGSIVASAIGLVVCIWGLFRMRPHQR